MTQQQDAEGPGLRLVKCVMAQTGGSRRAAEQWIQAGRVRLDGQLVTDPARRVRQETLVIDTAIPSLPARLTVLLHKPVDRQARQALQQSWPSLGLGPCMPADLQECMPLPDGTQGLSVWSSDPGVIRRLHDRQRPLEQEWLLSMPVDQAEGHVSALRQAGWRVSLGHAREGQGQWRVAGKALAGATPLTVPMRWSAAVWRRQRIGRVGLSPLLSAQVRLAQAFEKF